MRKAFLVLLSVLFVMGLAINSGAAEKEKGSAPHSGMYKHEDGCGCGGQYEFMGMFKKLGLDKKQTEAVREIHLKTMKAMIVKKLEGVKTEMKMMHIKAMEEIKSNLNAEQKEEFSSMIRHMMMKHEMMRHGMKGGECECHMHGMGQMHEKGQMKGQMKSEQKQPQH